MEEIIDGIFLIKGDSLEKLKLLNENSIDSVVTDSPYHLQSIVKRFGKSGSAPVKTKDGEPNALANAYARQSRGFMGKCYHPDTEILTKTGWKNITACSVDDVIATLNPDTRILEWQNVEETHAYDYVGNIFHIKHRSAEQKITPNHHMVISCDGGKTLNFCTPDKLPRAFHQFSQTSDIDGKTDELLTSNENVHQEFYDGKVFCVGVKKHHVIYTRFNGKPVWSGNSWDGGDISFNPELWSEVLRVLKPGGHMLAFGGTRTYHRMTCAIEDAGFEIRDMVGYIYGVGMPKSHDIAKQIDKSRGHWRGRATEVIDKTVGQVAKGTEYVRTDKGAPVTVDAKQWKGWGTALKPAWEPVCLARKPLSEKTIAANVLKWGTGALNIDATRITGDGPSPAIQRRETAIRTGKVPIAEQLYDTVKASDHNKMGKIVRRGTAEAFTKEHSGERLGRWPANLALDGSDEVVALFPQSKGQQGDVTGTEPSHHNKRYFHHLYGVQFAKRNDRGSAARFFFNAEYEDVDFIDKIKYTTKASKKDRAVEKKRIFVLKDDISQNFQLEIYNYLNGQEKK